jgi:hypothetical protein
MSVTAANIRFRHSSLAVRIYLRQLSTKSMNLRGFRSGQRLCRDASDRGAAAMAVSDRTPNLPPGNDPSRVITRALNDARRRGLDDLSQTRYAVAAVLTVRPDLSAIDAARQVEKVRRRSDQPR